MQGETQSPTQSALSDDYPEAVNALMKFRGCTDAYEGANGEIRATFSHDCPSGSVIGSKPQKRMLDLGYTVAMVSNSTEGQTAITYRKFSEL